jgi:hypothetical protein
MSLKCSTLATLTLIKLFVKFVETFNNLFIYFILIFSKNKFFCEGKQRINGNILFLKTKKNNLRIFLIFKYFDKHGAIDVFLNVGDLRMKN